MAHAPSCSDTAQFHPYLNAPHPGSHPASQFLSSLKNLTGFTVAAIEDCRFGIGDEKECFAPTALGILFCFHFPALPDGANLCRAYRANAEQKTAGHFCGWDSGGAILFPGECTLIVPRLQIGSI